MLRKRMLINQLLEVFTYCLACNIKLLGCHPSNVSRVLFDIVYDKAANLFAS